jgi:uncharacterized protein (DUF4415 family)
MPRETRGGKVPTGLGTSPDDVDAAMLARLRAAAAMPDEQIDLTDPDAPLVTDWRRAVQGKFFKPVKRLKSFRIDADVLDCFESQGKGYQTTVNNVLRDAMVRGLRNAGGGNATGKRPTRKA